MEKVKKDFEKIDVSASTQKNTGDDLLDLMDNLWLFLNFFKSIFNSIV